MKTLRWIKCQGDVWCKLNTVNLNHAHFDNLFGVYIIWHGGPNAATVYVGQGSIRERLKTHRINSDIQEYNNFELYVTWADVPLETERHGVEVYLSRRLRPKVGESYPNVTPIDVNLPW